MNYGDARAQIKPGDTLAWSHERWGSWYDLKVQAVRIFTRSEYCHIATAYELMGRLFCIEAVSAGVRFFPLSRALPFYWAPLRSDPAVNGLNAVNHWNAEAEEFAMQQIGAPYSQLQAMMAAVGLLKPAADQVWECAELHQELFRLQGIRLDCLATPSAVIDAVQMLGAAVHKVVA